MFVVKSIPEKVILLIDIHVFEEYSHSGIMSIHRTFGQSSTLSYERKPISRNYPFSVLFTLTQILIVFFRHFSAKSVENASAAKVC